MYLKFSVSENNVGRVAIDVPDAKVNVLSEALMGELTTLLDDISREKNLRGVVFYSAKSDNFIVGADLEAIRQLQSKSPIEAYQASQLGKFVFDKIEKLALPTVAAINGKCLGGGTELALACRYRIATNLAATSSIATNSSPTTIGLPEVKLGFVPGWGATVRLPRIVGLQAALDLILTGKELSARKAWKVGLIDEWVDDAALLLKRAEEIALGSEVRRYERPLMEKMQNVILEKTPIGRDIVAKQARKAVMRETKGKYPAPTEALKLVMKSGTRPLAISYEAESTAFAKLAVGHISRNLVGIFFAQTESKKMPVNIDVQALPEIKIVGVLGAGVMGAGIAQAAAYAGYRVILKDVEQRFLDKGMANIEKLFAGLLKRGKITQPEYEGMLAAVTPTLDYDKMRDCDLVIEAVLEVMEVKKEAMAAVERVNSKPFIFATNTSSLSVDRLADAAPYPDRVVGLHFFNPVHKMPLLEVVKGKQTAEVILAAAKAFGLKLGKTTVVTSDAPGFVVNRILAPYIREAVVLLEEGVPPQLIDKAMTSFGMPMGPITLMDEVGLDIAVKVAHVLHEELGARLAPPSMMAKLEQLKLLGKKGGKGFYLYDEHGKRSEFNPEVLAAVTVGTNPKQAGEIQDRLVLVMLNEAVRCLAEGVIKEPSQLDLSLIFGIGFPPFRGGILRYADHLGLQLVQQKLAFLAKVHGENYVPAALLVEKVAARQGFYGN